MKLPRLLRDTSGATALEFALTAPVFFALLGGVIQICLLMWTQVSLQHGAEMAARCASVDKYLCDTASKIQSYAATQSLGLSLPVSTFSVTTPSCGSQVQASYTFNFFFGYFGISSLPLTAQSCFPK